MNDEAKENLIGNKYSNKRNKENELEKSVPKEILLSVVYPGP